MAREFVPQRERPLINKIGSGVLDGIIRSATYGALSTDRINRIRNAWHNMMERHRAGGGQQPILRAQPVEGQGPYEGYQSVSGPTIPDWISQLGTVAPGQVSAVIGGQPVLRAGRAGRAPGVSVAQATGIPRYGLGGAGVGDATLRSAGFGGGGSFDFAPGGGGRVSQFLLKRLLY